MATVWVLDTSTKGTGATMVPLEKVLRKRSEHVEPIYVPPPRTPKPSSPPDPRPPRSFKIVDILTRQVLTEGATAQAAIEVLNDVRSIVDVNIYVWQPKTEKWRLLSFDERRALWDYRDAPKREATRAGRVSEVGGS
jgi:hypothetical protein